MPRLVPPLLLRSLVLRSAIVGALILGIASSAKAQQSPSIVGLKVIGTAFQVTLSDGSVKTGQELVGAILDFEVNGDRLHIKIANIEPDPLDRTGTVFLYDFRVEKTGIPICTRDPDGKQLGFPLAGRTMADGSFATAELGGFELVCSSGAQGKCVRFGYHPWEVASTGRPMRDYFNACVRLIRADYCGDGRTWTRDGTAVDLWDDLGIQRPYLGGAASFSFEAGWGPKGAVCVAHPRIPQILTLQRVQTNCPWLSELPDCYEGAARRSGALLFNRSK